MTVTDARVMTEAQLQACVLDAAARFGWLAFHPYDSRLSAGAGYPDITLSKRLTATTTSPSSCGESSSGGTALSWRRSVADTAWDAGCGPILYLTVRRGPRADTTLAHCTCQWERVYKTRRKAEKRGAEHLVLANGKVRS